MRSGLLSIRVAETGSGGRFGIVLNLFRWIFRPGILAAGGLVGQLLLTLFFLLLLFCQVALAFFELVVGFGQGGTFESGKR